MIDRVLVEEVGQAEGLLARWVSLRTLVSETRQGRAAGGQEYESLRDALAQGYPALAERLEIAVGEGDELVQFLSRLHTLSSVAALSEMQWKKTEEAMGRIEVGLQGLLGILKARRDCVERVSGGRLVMVRIMSSWPFKLLSLVAGILIFFLVLGRVLR